MKTENQWVVCSNVDALNGGYISRSEEGLPLMDLSYCFFCKKEKRKKKKGKLQSWSLSFTSNVKLVPNLFFFLLVQDRISILA